MPVLIMREHAQRVVGLHEKNVPLLIKQRGTRAHTSRGTELLRRLKRDDPADKTEKPWGTQSSPNP